MKIYRKAAFLLAAASILNCGAYAYAEETVKVSTESSKYHISGNFKEAEFNNTAFFSVKDGEGNLVHFDGISTGSDGSLDYYFVMPTSAPTGKYKFYISGYDSTEATLLKMGEDSEITYINPNDTADALDEIDAESAKTDGNVAAVIEQNKYKLRIAHEKYSEYYEALPQANKNLVADSVKSAAPYNKDIEKFEGAFYKALALQSVRAAEKTKIEAALADFAAYCSIENENTYALYQKLDAYKNDVLEKFAQSVISYDDFDKSFNEACILIGIYRSNTWGDVAEILKDYSTDIPFTISESNLNAVARAVVGKNYKDMAALKDAADAIVTIPGNPGGGNNSGSSKGSNKSNKSDFPISSEINNSLNPSQENENKDIFADINEAAWAKDAIEYLNKKNIMSGYDGKVYPNKKITREEFVRIVLDAFGLFEDGKTVDFADVSPSDWAYKYIACAVDKGIVSGISEEYFGKGQEISRQDMAVIIMRALYAAGKASDEESGETGFRDGSEISEYALESVKYMTSRKYINGFEDGSFKPRDGATRAQAARILYAILNENGEDNK